MARVLVAEETIRELVEKGSKTLAIPQGAIVTPLARELAEAHGILIETTVSDGPRPAGKEETEAHSTGDSDRQVVAIGSDHGGFGLKEQLKPFVEEMGYGVIDVGTASEATCDYPDFAYAVAQAVASGKAWRGIIVDGAGIGSCVVANKVPGIRAACCHSEFAARNAREHNDTNILTLGSRVTGSELCKEIVRVWLTTWFGGGRHKSRVSKIDDIERRFLK